MTGIRAVAVFLVFWHHAAAEFDDAPSSGMVGVSLFYLISGFVMAWTDRPTDTPWLFYRRRFARIYPAYLVACLAAFALLLAGGVFRPTDLAALTLLQSWVPAESVYFAGNAVFWSLSCEAFFYAVFPWLRLMTRRLSTVGLWSVGATAAAVSCTIGITASLFPLTQPIQWAVVVFPVSRLPEFVIGVVLGSLMVRGWTPRVPIWLASALATFAVGAALATPYAVSRYVVTLVPFVLLIVALAAADVRGAASFARWRPMVVMGTWSYCFYLVHAMVLTIVFALVARAGIDPWVGTPAALVGSVVASWLLHILVERPAERRLRPAGPERLDQDAPARLGKPRAIRRWLKVS